MSNELITSLNIYDIVEDYDKKQKAIPTLLDELKAQAKALENVCTTMGTYGGQIFDRDLSWTRPEHLLQCLKVSSWRYVYNALNIKHIAPQTHVKEFERQIEDPPEFTIDNIQATFKEYVTNSRGMSLMAFAEIFCNLDRFYKSHSNIKVGVKGLPKRVVLTGCGEFGYGYGNERGADVVNALMRYRGHYGSCITSHQFCELSKKGDYYNGLSFKRFKNGNVHIHFDQFALDDINRALSEYYGNVVPDAYEHTEKPAASTAVSKDLQFYGTPPKAVAKLLDEVHWHSGMTILEPSCGDGAILDGIREYVKERNNDPYSRNQLENIKVVGVEFHSGRAAIAKGKRHPVLVANFLDWQTNAKFSHVIMNPPFSGQHYVKHIDKAYELLEPGGCLVSILPITARDNHGILDKKYKCSWRDLPVGSFLESGTGINTVICKIWKDKQ